jgi:hypothetical protein
MLRYLRVAAGACRVALAVAVVLLAVCPAAKANDSSASLEIGGLRLTYNPDIELREEDLFLSTREIRVAYKFFNKSNSDVHTVVAIPLPRIENGEAGNYAIKSADPVNVIGFEVVVDGQPVKPAVEIRAISRGLDVTKLLQKYGLPLTTITADADARGRLNDFMRDLPMDARRELETFGVIDWRSSFDKDGKPDANPRWKTNITFYWLQTFPAGRVIEIRHRYRPVPRDFITSMEEINSERIRKSYCVDPDFARAAQAREKAIGTMIGRELRYILSTAENWSGPIQKFRLTIDKGSPEALVSLCFDGIKRTGPTTFVATRDNYQAVEDLGILLLDKPSDD